MSSTQEVGDIFGAAKGQAQAMLRSPTVLIVAIGLWGMNIFFFRLFGINYRYVLRYDLLKEQQQLQQQQQSNSTLQVEESSAGNQTTGAVAAEKAGMATSATITSDSTSPTLSAPASDGAAITWYKLVLFSFTLLVFLHIITHFWMDHLGQGVLGAIGLYYLAVVAYIFLPLRSNEWLRRAFWITMERTYALIHPRCWYFRTTKTVYSHNASVSASSSSEETITTSNVGTGTTNTTSTSMAGTAAATSEKQSAGTISTIAITSTTTNSGGSVELKGKQVPIIPRAVPFIDVFYADAMCSLSKVFFDWGYLLHLASHYPEPVPKELSQILIPSAFAAIPFLIRARQCLLMHSIGRLQQDPKRYQHLANAIKYSTSIWPLMLSAYQKTLDNPASAEKLDGLLVLLQTINAMYALYWDIVMDWGMMQNPQALVAQACTGGGMLPMSHKESLYNHPLHSMNSNSSTGSSGSHHHKTKRCHHLVLRPRLRYGLTMSALIVMADTFLRFSWMLRFVSHQLFVSQDAFVLCTQFLEVFRRAIWNLLRIEWENIKQKSKQLKARDSLSDHEEEDDLDFDDPYGNSGHESFKEPAKHDMDQEMVSFLKTTTKAVPMDRPATTTTSAVSSTPHHRH